MDQSTYFISSLNNESCPLGVSEWATQTILSKDDVTQSPTNILGNLRGFFIHKWRSTTFPKAYFRIFKKKYHVDFFSTNDAPRRSRKTNFRISCGFFFHKWRSTIYPVCGFFFHNLQIGVNLWPFCFAVMVVLRPIWTDAMKYFWYRGRSSSFNRYLQRQSWRLVCLKSGLSVVT